jgi:hypothetical protein
VGLKIYLKKGGNVMSFLGWCLFAFVWSTVGVLLSLCYGFLSGLSIQFLADNIFISFFSPAIAIILWVNNFIIQEKESEIKQKKTKILPRNFVQKTIRCNYYSGSEKFFYISILALSLPILVNAINWLLTFFNYQIITYFFEKRFSLIWITFLVMYFPRSFFRKLVEKFTFLKKK